ncbi:MAG: hypothetical protein HYZ62_01860, partial [Candidatus Andersenbacteria bacterium]|nr:hypothetical protein [Candidatus Andersenbacteria bacterium]
VAAVILGIAFWQDGFWLGAKTKVPGLILSQGQTYVATYKTTPKAPSVKIELCRGKKCSTLAAKAAGMKKNVDVPKDYSIGGAQFKISERNAAGALTGKIQKTIAVTITAGAAVPRSQPTAPPAATPTFSFNFPGSTFLPSAEPTAAPAPKPPVIAYKLKLVCIQERRDDIARSMLVEWEPKTAILGYRFGKGDLSTKPWWYPSMNTGASIIPLLNGYYAQIPTYGYPKIEIQLKPALPIWRDTGGSEIYTFDAGPEPLIVAGGPIAPGAKLPPRVTPAPPQKCLYRNP